mgnify:CR=1 FL=1
MKYLKIILVLLIISMQLTYSQNNWFQQGEKYLVENKFLEAVQAFTRVIDLTPDNTSAYYNRGLAYLYLMKPEEAINDLNIFIAKDTTVSDAFNNRGLAYSIIGKEELAITDFNKALELDSSFAQAYINRGAAYMALNSYKESINDFTKAINLDKKNPAAYYQRGLVYYKAQDYEKSIKDFTKTLELGLKKGRVYYNRGNALYKLGQYEKAVKDYDKAIKEDPNDAEAINNRAMSYDMLGKKDKAKEDRERLSKIVNKQNVYTPIDSLTFIKYSDPSEEISINLPDNWHKVIDVEDNSSTMIISLERIEKESDYYSVGVRLTIEKKMNERYNVSNSADILNFWEGSLQQNSSEYHQYNIFSKKIFSKYGYSGYLNKVSIQATKESFPVRMYELALAKEGILIYGFFQAPEPVFAYYQQIFDKAIESLVLKQ